MKAMFSRFWADQSAATAIEYGLIAAGISLAIIAAVNYRGQSDAAIKIAVQALSDIDPTVRVTAADSLRSLRATDAIPALQSSLQSEGDEIAREHLRETLRVLQLAADRDKKEKERETPR